MASPDLLARQSLASLVAAIKSVARSVTAFWIAAINEAFSIPASAVI